MVFYCKVATIWSIKKETFTKIINEDLYSETIQTTVDGYEYKFGIRQRNGDVAIFITDEEGVLDKTTIKELSVSIPSANFEGDLSTDAEVQEGHKFHGYTHTVVLKYGNMLNPDKKYFVDDILTLKFHGIIEYIEKPKPISLNEMLWDADDKDFTIIVDDIKIKAHKVVLRRYSSVLANMFDSNVHQIEETEYDYDTVGDIIRLCYDMPGEEGYQYHKLIVCLHYADVYDMPLIKEQIAHRLSDSIYSYNVCELANKSIEYKCPTLKGYCISFILKCMKVGTPYDGESELNAVFVQDLLKSLKSCDTLNY